MTYDSIRRYEGFRDKAYQDQGGKWTIGYGQTEINGRPVQPNDVISRDAADKAWGAQVAPYANKAREIAPHLTPQQHEALTSLIYNYGVDSPRVSKLAGILQAGDMQRARDYWLASNTVKGIPNAGLGNRRAQEWAMFSGAGSKAEGSGSASSGKQAGKQLSPFQRLNRYLTDNNTEPEHPTEQQELSEQENAQPVIAESMVADEDPNYRNTPFRRFIRRLEG